MYLLPKMKFLDKGIQKLEPKQDTHTHTQTDVTDALPRCIHGSNQCSVAKLWYVYI